MSMTLEEAISHVEQVANSYNDTAPDCDCAVEHRQLAKWLKALKKAQFEYHEAWLIITHPTPDVKPADKDRAQVILDTFRDSLGGVT